MGQINALKTEIRDVEAVKTSCQWLGLAEPVQGKTKLISSEVEGMAVSEAMFRRFILPHIQRLVELGHAYRGTAACCNAGNCHLVLKVLKHAVPMMVTPRMPRHSSCHFSSHGTVAHFFPFQTMRPASVSAIGGPLASINRRG